MHWQWWFVVPLAAGLAGCATVAKPPLAANEGSTSYRRVDDSQMAHYQLALGDIATGGKPLARVLPAYPPAQLAACPPLVEVQVQVIVDATGRAQEVRPYPPTSQLETPTAPAYVEAVRAAVRQWSFAPLQISHWAADADGNTHAVDSSRKPFSLVYAFRFSCRAGQAMVTSAPG